jgi:hypothetical protein
MIIEKGDNESTLFDPISDEELVLMTYNVLAIIQLCNLCSLDLQLRKEEKLKVIN